MAAYHLLPHLLRFEDTCNVYVLIGRRECLAIDFGSGAWLSDFESLGLPPIRRVYLTHHHPDQCAGLEQLVDPPCELHAPIGEEQFLEPVQVDSFWAKRHIGGVPPSYCVLRSGIRGIHYDMRGFTTHFWGEDRLRFLHTPGHGPNALSIVATVDDQQVVFCGDAAYAGATIWRPYQLEWDHWQGTGALAAWEGVQRLQRLGMDLLCPSHGPVIDKAPRQQLAELADKLMALYHAKGSICPGEKDAYLPPVHLDCGARQVLPGLYQFGGNGYLLQAESGESLLIDAHLGALDELEALLKELDHPNLSACTATHYHADHTDAIPLLKERYDLQCCLHPRVYEPLRPESNLDVPFLPPQPIVADQLMPETGEWPWDQYTFRVAPFPGQTWWHACFMTEVAGQQVLFAGDSFQPPSRWNGTGGFCAYNGCRFDAFVRSAQLVLEWQPDLLACGHGTYYHFQPSQFRKICDWALLAEEAVRALCPSGDLRRDYFLHGH